jgi:hypothetical protein
MLALGGPAYFTALILSRFKSGVVRAVFFLILYVVLCSIFGFILETFYFYITPSGGVSSALNVLLGFLLGFPMAIFLLMFFDKRKREV